MKRSLAAVTSSRSGLVVVLLLCLVLRLGIIAYQANQPLVCDADLYSSIAVSIAHGHGFRGEGESQPTARSDPLYPFFVSAFYWLFGIDPLPVLLAQAALATLTCWLLFRFMIMLGGTAAAALAACFLYSIYPPFVMAPASLLTETLAMFLTLTSIILLLLAVRGRRVAWLLAAFAMGLMILNKGSMLLFPALLAVAIGVFWRKLGVRSARPALCLLAAYLLVVPWTVRNYIALGGFAPLTTYGWSSIWAGSGVADGYTISWWSLPVHAGEKPANSKGEVYVRPETYEKITALQKRALGMPDIDREAFLRNEALNEIRAHPLRFAFLGVKKSVRFWFNLWYDDPPSKKSLALAAANLVFILAFLAAFYNPRIDLFVKTVVALLALYTMGVSAISLSVVRQSFPIFTFVIAFAVFSFSPPGRTVDHHASQVGDAITNPLP